MSVHADAMTQEPPLSTPTPSRRTITRAAGLIVTLVVLVVAARGLAAIDPGAVAGALSHAMPVPLIGAALTLWLGIIARGERWHRLLEAAGVAVSRREATSALLSSWALNCVAPARLGDAARGAILRGLAPGTRAAVATGTVVLERLLDLAVVVLAGSITGAIVLGSQFPAPLVVIGVALGLGLFAGCALLLWVPPQTLHNFVAHHRLPAPIRSLAGGVALGLAGVHHRDVPGIAARTVLIWASEAARLYLVWLALGLAGGRLDVAAAIMVAFTGSLLSTIPLTPAGFGLVEGGIFGLLTVGLGLGAPAAAAVVLIDRSITVGLLLVTAAAVTLAGRAWAALRPARAS